MNLQYISDSSGKTTGVFIPINEWNELKNKFEGIEQQEIAIPDWHIEQVRGRIKEFNNQPDQLLDFDNAIDNIEKEL